MENIIRGTTPSLILDFADITDFTVQDIDAGGNTGYWLGGVTYNWFAW